MGDAVALALGVVVVPRLREQPAERRDGRDLQRGVARTPDPLAHRVGVSQHLQAGRDTGEGELAGGGEGVLGHGPDQRGGLGGPSRGRDDVDCCGACTSQVTVRKIENTLVVGVTVDRTHKPMRDPECVI